MIYAVKREKSESQRAFEEILQTAPIAIFEFDFQTSRLVMVNSALCSLTGYSEEELLAMNPLDLLHPESVKKLKERTMQALSGDKLENTVEYGVTTKDGTQKWAVINVKPTLKDGKTIGEFAVAYEITERKKAEEALRLSEERFRLVAEAAKVLVYEVELGKDEIHVFRGEEVIGCKPGQMPRSDKWWFDQIHPEDKQETERKFREAAALGRDVLLEYRMRFGGGDYIVVHDMAKPVKDNYGKVTRIIGGVRNVTERKKTEQALLQRTEELERTKEKLENYAAKTEEYASQLATLAEDQARKLKDAERLSTIGQTAGMVGHDIRNPLQAISGDVYLLKDYLTEMPSYPLKAQVAESLEGIEKNVEYIDKIVADLQDYARPLRPDYNLVNVSNIITKITQTSIPSNIALTVNADESINIISDHTFIRRALTNLITNAVQAMPNGGRLTINASKKLQKVNISVEDTGVGMPKDVRDKIFTPMLTTKAKGQGFGLAVVKRLVEALGGTVNFESEEGKGTKFVIELPASKSDVIKLS